MSAPCAVSSPSAPARSNSRSGVSHGAPAGSTSSTIMRPVWIATLAFGHFVHHAPIRSGSSCGVEQPMLREWLLPFTAREHRVSEFRKTQRLGMAWGHCRPPSAEAGSAQTHTIAPTTPRRPSQARVSHPSRVFSSHDSCVQPARASPARPRPHRRCSPSRRIRRCRPAPAPACSGAESAI